MSPLLTSQPTVLTLFRINLITLLLIFYSISSVNIVTGKQQDTLTCPEGTTAQPQVYYGVQYCFDGAIQILIIDSTNEKVRFETVLASGYDQYGNPGECRDVNTSGRISVDRFPGPRCQVQNNNTRYPAEFVGKRESSQASLGMVDRHPSAVVAFNTDFFDHTNYAWGPQGLTAKNGNRFDGPCYGDDDANGYNGRNGPSLAISKYGEIHIGMAANEAPDDCKVDESGKQAPYVTDVDKYWNTVGGGPILVKDNKIRDGINTGPDWDCKRGRTAVGRTGGGEMIVIVVPDPSVRCTEPGLTLVELAIVLISLGAQDAINLDGGGSSQLWYDGRYLVSSSRPVPEGLLVFSEKIPPATTSAQNGVNWLQTAAVNWQNHHRCIGCHVQPKAIQAAAIAKDNGFQFDDSAMAALMNFMRARQRGGGDFGGWAIGEEHHAAPGFAAYDRFVSDDARPNLLALANWFLSQQQQDGRWKIDRHEPPVDQGDILVTAHAIGVLAQAYNRTDDVRLSTAMQLGAQWLELQRNIAATTQDKAHIIIGLMASGLPANNSSVQAMADVLKREQRADGGWQDTGGGESTAHGTGQALFALRLAGMRLDDPIVNRGVEWLIQNQEVEGSWPLTDNSDPRRRSKYSPTMWGVLGLVQTVDLTPPTLVPPILPIRVPKWTSFVIELFDNLAGSGINPASIVVRLDGIVVPSFYIPALNRVIVFVNPLQIHTLSSSATALETHVLTIDARDNQGNSAQQLVIPFTVDAELLAVESVTPDNGAINVPIDTNTRVTFSLPVDPATITSSTIFLLNQSNEPVPGTTSYNANTKTVTFAPTSPLDFRSYYVLKIHGGESGVHSGNNQPLTMNYEFGFRTVAGTGDVTSPIVTSVRLQEDGSITVQFSEPMNPLTVNGSTILLTEQTTGISVPGVVAYDPGVQTATFTPLANPDFTKKHQLRVMGGLGGVADLADNPMTVDHVTRSISTILYGDCNNDQSVGAADLTALALEFFDGDDNNNPNDTPNGSYPGTPACDANEDGRIGASDLTCIALIFFNGPGACQVGQGAAIQTEPALIIPASTPAEPGDQVTVPITLQGNGAEVSSLLFSLDFDETWLTFDPADHDGDGIPDAITFTLPDGFVRSATFDSSDGDAELDIMIASFASPALALPDGPLLSVTFDVGVPTGIREAVVVFAQEPAPSFGDTSGRAQAGVTSSGSVLISESSESAPLSTLYLPFVSHER
jgi:hypothetical protein